MNENFKFVIPIDHKVIFPEFTSTVSLPYCTVEPLWKRPEEIVEHLKKLGSPIKSRVSLLNYERRGLLTARRESAKKVYYDLYEVEKLFNSKKINEKPYQKSGRSNHCH